MNDQTKTQQKIKTIIQNAETLTSSEKDQLIQKIEFQTFTSDALEELLKDIQIQEDRRDGPWIQEHIVQKKYLQPDSHPLIPSIHNPFLNQEKISEDIPLDIQPSDLETYEECIQDFQKRQQQFGTEKAFFRLNEWTLKHPSFSLLRFLDLFLLSALVDNVESIHLEPTLTEEGYTQKMYSHIETILDRLINRVGGKPFATFYLRSLYESGIMDKNHPLFSKLVELDFSFLKQEQEDFENQQKELQNQQDQLKTQWEKQKDKSTKQQKNKRWLQQKLLSVQQISLLLDRYFPREWANLQLRITEVHRTLNDWDLWGGSEADRIKKEANQKLETLQQEWFALIQKLENQKVFIPTYTNPENESHCILSPVIGREIDVRSGRIIKTDEEFWRDMGLLALDFISIVAALYTAGLGSAAMRTMGKRMMMNAFLTDVFATTVVSGSVFSVSSKTYQNIIKTPWQNPDWSAKHLLKDIPKDILLFSVLRGLTLKFDPLTGKSLQRFSTPLKQTSSTVGTLVGFTQTERMIENLYDGKTLKKSVIHNLQELPNDILITIGFLMGLQGTQFALIRISATKIEYSADKNEIILETLKNFVGEKNVQDLGNGKIRVLVQGKEIVFERTPADLDAIKQRKQELLKKKPKKFNTDMWNEVVEYYYEDFSFKQIIKAYQIHLFLKNNGVKHFQYQIVKSANIETTQIIESSSQDIIVYRFYGKGSSQFSYYYVPTDIRFIPFFEIADMLALPDQNSIERVSKVLIPKGSPMLIGDISPQKADGIDFLSNKFGGGKQIYYPLRDKNVKVLEDHNLNDLQHGIFK